MVKRPSVGPQEIFISHSSRDHRFVQKIVTVLRGHGVPVWHSPTNLIGAQQWHDEIGRALARCDWFLLVASPNAVKSIWVKHEYMYAFRSGRYDGRIVPLLHKPCDLDRLSWTLASFQRVDFSTDFTSDCRDLLRIWGLGYFG